MSQQTTAASTSFYHKYQKWLWTIFGIVFVFLLWFILAATYHSVAIPNPLSTFRQIGILLGDKHLYMDIGATLVRLLLAFVVSFILGSLIGLLAGLYKPVYTFLRPLIITLRTLPTAAVILIFVTLVSSTHAPYYVVFLVVFPLAYEAMANGIKNLPEEYDLALRLEGHKRARSIFMVRVPIAGPYIVLGLLQSLGLAMKVEIMSEILSGNMNMNGLGVAIKVFIRDVDMVNVFAYSVVAIVLTGIIELAIYLLKRRLTIR